MPRQAIQNHATALQVPYLLHFTRIENLSSILGHGLYPRARVAELGAAPVVNDQYRWDGHTDSSSLSIGFPNCQMLYRYRMADEASEWAILVINPAVLWVKECAFCRHNAADGRISSQQLTDLTTPEAFIGMFEEIEGLEARSDQKLKPFDPTDVQGEVLVFDVIEPSLIYAVVFQTEAARDRYADHTGERKVYIHPNSKGMFATRNYVRKFS